MVKCFSGTCVKIKIPSNEHRYCDITGKYDTECIYDNPKVTSVSTVNKGIPNIKTIQTKALFIYSRKQDIFNVTAALTCVMDLLMKSVHGFGYTSQWL